MWPASSDHRIRASQASCSPSSNDNEWSRVFDLTDTLLVCYVKGNQLDLQLVHLTTAPFDKAIARARKERNAGQWGPSSSFITTYTGLKEEMEKSFEKYERALLFFSGGNIVPNLTISKN